MARKRSTNVHLPPRMRQKGASFYYDTQQKPRKWIPLGQNYQQALIEWAKLEGRDLSPELSTLATIYDYYKRDVYPSKSPATQKGNDREAAKLLLVFGDSSIDSITPADVQRYMEARGATARVRANREKALLSHVWNFARAKGYTSLPNPCTGIKGYRERGRDKYVSDAEYKAVWERASQPLRDAMDLAYLTGQRPSDVLKLALTDIQDGTLVIKQNKTGTKLRIVIEGELEALIERIKTREQKTKGLRLVQDEQGHSLTYWQLANRFEEARAAAGVTFQFRDIRAKAATDVGGLDSAQQLLGHASRAMSEHYVKKVAGSKVRPVNRKL
ncbi:integrase [Pandoraea communis]|uniref:Integrase n=1 Tax=Pandoraea communis TaxID=2508297 RepID=A0A5E4YI64_9BURK|nr:tyrosine-type recombinase/integrase [Pandoraea communis]VVE47713.1 integrase [Pandoraea communis]